MSRIGKAIIELPKGVEFNVSGTTVTVKGAKGTLTQEIDPSISVEINDNVIEFKRESDDKDVRSKHGLYRSLINNMIKGVSEGYTIKQELVGVGYKASIQGQLLDLSLGYSHNIIFELPAEVKGTALTEKGKNPTITLESIDKQLVGQVAAKIRSLRKPEPYKGKGIRFVGEQIRRKAGKSAGK